ncbi:phosphoribosyltransferase [Candidatus Peregrinibacteria bacterium]|nr:phosphoribosyltransferase [Candidatus Peregrinibacteria bacterium]
MFSDRTEAGTLLAEKLSAYKAKPDTLILALVRGGVAIGRVLADTLALPLYPYIVRKIGFPGHREFGIGALAEGGATFLDEDLMKTYGLSFADIEPIIEEETAEMKRRVQAYNVRPRPDLKGKTIILTDDGAATGGTMFAAIDDLRQKLVQKILVALPVCPPDTAEQLQKKADDTIILHTPTNFNAVGRWYKEFPQLEDEEVVTLLRKH